MSSGSIAVSASGKEFFSESELHNVNPELFPEG